MKFYRIYSGLFVEPFYFKIIESRAQPFEIRYMVKEKSNSMDIKRRVDITMNFKYWRSYENEILAKFFKLSVYGISAFAFSLI